MLCQICEKELAKYKCPACGCQTCSLNCVRLHKIRFNCTGQKPKTEFVPMKDMTSDILYKDINLYDKANIALINASDKLPQKFSKLSQNQKKLRKACSERGIELSFMPSMSSRSKSNKSQISREEKDTILWTIQWRFFNEDKKLMYEFITPKKRRYKTRSCS